MHTPKLSFVLHFDGVSTVTYRSVFGKLFDLRFDDFNLSDEIAQIDVYDRNTDELVETLYSPTTNSYEVAYIVLPAYLRVPVDYVFDHIDGGNYSAPKETLYEFLASKGISPHSPALSYTEAYDLDQRLLAL